MKKNQQSVKGSVLVVEDEKIIAKDIANILKKFGYIVPAIASSGEEALRKLEEMQFDLVLMDIVLKGNIDGVEAAKQIYERYGLPVVHLTAYADDETLERVKQTQTFGYIIKPFKERELYTAIEIALHRHRAMQEQQSAEEKKVEDLRMSLQKLQQFSDVKDLLFKKFLQDLSGPVFNLNMAIHLLRDAPSDLKREHYLRILEEEFAREVELINQTSNLGDLLSVENVELLNQFSLLKQQQELPRLSGMGTGGSGGFASMPASLPHALLAALSPSQPQSPTPPLPMQPPMPSPMQSSVQSPPMQPPMPSPMQSPPIQQPPMQSPMQPPMELPSSPQPLRVPPSSPPMMERSMSMGTSNPKIQMRPLNQTQLAERLGVVVSAITYWKFKSGFPEWSRSKDPEGVSWRYSPDSKRFSPVG